MIASIALIGLIAGLSILAFSAWRPLLNWAAEEWRLIRLREWSDGAYDGPAPLTASDPRCANTIARLAQARDELRRTKRGLLDKREVPDDFLAHTDVRATIRAANPPVRLMRRSK